MGDWCESEMSGVLMVLFRALQPDLTDGFTDEVRHHLALLFGYAMSVLSPDSIMCNLHPIFEIAGHEDKQAVVAGWNLEDEGLWFHLETVFIP